MAISVRTLEKLLAAGLAGDALVDVLRSIEADHAKPERSKNAERQARFRERNATDDVTGNVSGDLFGSPSSSPLKENLPDPLKKITPHHQPLPIPAGAFGSFWAEYPQKVGRGAAIKAFAKAWVKIDDPDPLDVMVMAVRRYRATKPPDRDWCHPSTWLNQERWTDEPAPQSSRPSKFDRDEANLARAFTGAQGALARQRERR